MGSARKWRDERLLIEGTIYHVDSIKINQLRELMMMTIVRGKSLSPIGLRDKEMELKLETREWWC